MKTVRVLLAFSIGSGEVHVWLIDLDRQESDGLHWEAVLPQDEIARSGHYRFAHDRNRFLARRGILRVLLGRYAGLEPRSITYATNPFGKLFLPFTSATFSLSHSRNRIALAFAAEMDLGVDIEEIRPLPDLTALVEDVFSGEEQRAFASVSPSMRLEAFYHVWTQKEAFIKARGEGFSLSLKEFSVSVDPREPGGLLSFNHCSANASHWHSVSGFPEPNRAVAVCAHADTKPRIMWHAPNDPGFWKAMLMGDLGENGAKVVQTMPTPLQERASDSRDVWF